MTQRQTAIDIQLFLPFQIAQLHSLLNAQARAIIAKHGQLTLPQWRVIRLISMGITNTTTAVRKAANIDKSQFSKTLAALVDDGMVIVAPYAEDRRQFQITLTPKGEKAHAVLAPELDRRHEHLLAALSPAQRASIYGAIQALASAAETSEFPELTQPMETI